MLLLLLLLGHNKRILLLLLYNRNCVGLLLLLLLVYENVRLAGVVGPVVHRNRRGVGPSRQHGGYGVAADRVTAGHGGDVLAVSVPVARVHLLLVVDEVLLGEGGRRPLLVQAHVGGRRLGVGVRGRRLRGHQTLGRGRLGRGRRGRTVGVRGTVRAYGRAVGGAHGASLNRPRVQLAGRLLLEAGGLVAAQGGRDVLGRVREYRVLVPVVHLVPHGTSALGVGDASGRVRGHRAVHVHRRLGGVALAAAVQGRGTGERGRLWLGKVPGVVVALLAGVVVVVYTRLTGYRAVQQRRLLGEVTAGILQERWT